MNIEHKCNTMVACSRCWYVGSIDSGIDHALQVHGGDAKLKIVGVSPDVAEQERRCHV